MRIPFNIKFRPQIESGEYKVETRNGRPARIVCWDRKLEIGFTPHPISALVMVGCNEQCFAYTIDGLCNCNRCNSSQDDLFIITPDPELSDFEKVLSECLCLASLKPELENYDSMAREYGVKLLELAKKEALEVYRAQNINEREMGKVKALANMPKWKRADEKLYLDRMCLIYEGNCITAKKYGEVPKGAFYLCVCDLLNLPGLDEQK